MNNLLHTEKNILISLGLLCCISLVHAQNAAQVKQIIDIEKERQEIEKLDTLYSKFLLEGDSVALANMYTKDAQMGTVKGDEILSAFGKWIRSGIKNDSRHVTFKRTTLTADVDLLIETGIGEARSDNGELKYTFRYVVVWKKEDGTWKLYRDIGL